VTLRHDDDLFDDIAALAVGALPDADALQLEEHLARCTVCQAEYRAARGGLDVVLAATEFDGTLLPGARADALRSRVMTAARAARPIEHAGYSAVVARDALIPYAPGIEWAVVAERNVTMVYWIFTPPECGEIPPESHTVTQAGFVLEGAMEMHYGDTTVMCRPGDFYTIAPGTVHGAIFPERTVLVDIYAPNNTDFERQYRESAAARV